MKKVVVFFFNNRFLGEMKYDDLPQPVGKAIRFKAGDVFEKEDMERLNVQAGDIILGCVWEDDGKKYEYGVVNPENLP